MPKRKRRAADEFTIKEIDTDVLSQKKQRGDKTPKLYAQEGTIVEIKEKQKNPEGFARDLKSDTLPAIFDFVETEKRQRMKESDIFKAVRERFSISGPLTEEKAKQHSLSAVNSRVTTPIHTVVRKFINSDELNVVIKKNTVQTYVIQLDDNALKQIQKHFPDEPLPVLVLGNNITIYFS